MTQTLPVSDLAQFVFDTPEGSVVAIGGIDLAALRTLVDQSEVIASDRRVLFVRMQPAARADAYVEQLIAIMADTALRLWPVWYTDVSFAMCRNDAIGRQAAGVIAYEAAALTPGVSASWTEAAASLALRGESPRVAGALPAVELAQLSRTINRAGLILVVDVAAPQNDFSAIPLLHALEWIALHSAASVIAQFACLPSLDSPFDRILYGAREVFNDTERGPSNERLEAAHSEIWLAPWRGAPHPLSEIEQRLSAMLSLDPELNGLFHFNWSVATVRNTRPRVDLVWLEGLLVVELDGYADHSARHAFIADRHRDYELALSGYTVLRLANDEVMQDYGRAIQKIRDLVGLRRSAIRRG